MLDSEMLRQLLQEQRTTNAILRAAFRPQLEELRDRVTNDEVMVAILQQLGQGSRSAGDLKSATAKAARASERTVSRRLGDLELLGVIEERGGGGRVSYVLTGLVMPD